MDKLNVHHGHHNGISKPPVHGHGGKGSRRGGGKGIKVVYISSPMKLTASAEEFRAVVQELTGRDSNVAEHDLAQHYHHSSLGRASSTTPAAASARVGPRAVPPTMATANAGAGRSTMTVDHCAAAGGAAGVVAAAPAPFQSMYQYDQTPSYLYGHDYW
ncbi:hypothetical protein ABZP36_017711 [Zizania latifolia]